MTLLPAAPLPAPGGAAVDSVATGSTPPGNLPGGNGGAAASIGAAEALADEAARLGALRGHARTVREHVVGMASGPTGAHLGGSLSATDILVALYFDVMAVRAEEPRWADRDRFVLSKGHAGCAYFATLAERGFFDRAELARYGTASGLLSAHPTLDVPGVEFATGSLGHGLSLGVGSALAALRNGATHRTFVLLGDGELQEGSVWEAAMSAAQLRLGRLTAVVDRNGLQISGPTEDRMALEPLADKWRSFGWRVSDVDGHDFARLLPALRGETAGDDPDDARPHVVIARTVKGKGVRSLERRKQSHFARLTPRLRERALASLEAGS